MPSAGDIPRQMKATLNATAAKSSTAKVILAICNRSRRMLRGESTLSIDSRTAMRFRKPTLCPTNSAAMVVTVMIPSPPSWTSTMTTTAPNVVKVAGKSTVERPVTLPALTETNMASTHEMPCSVEKGSLRSTVPSAISARKPTTISRGVESLLDNTFSRVVATLGLRTVTADPGQYTREPGQVGSRKPPQPEGRKEDTIRAQQGCISGKERWSNSPTATT